MASNKSDFVHCCKSSDAPTISNLSIWVFSPLSALVSLSCTLPRHVYIANCDITV